MKRFYTFLLAIFITATIFSQAPQKMSYQAVIRNTGNSLVQGTTVGMRISILQGSASGAAVYTETQTPVTNANGLATIEIGAGITFDKFSSVNWESGPYFIKTETDPAGGTNYTITGTSQLLSVPYALYAEYSKSSNKHYVGESYGGGIVYYVYDNGQHGLIASLADQGTGYAITWNNNNGIKINATADGLGAGFKNTLIMTAVHTAMGANYGPDIYCNDYSVTVGGVKYGDWYLPSKYELNLLYAQRSILGSFATIEPYWSSTEIDNNNVWTQYFDNGSMVVTNKYLDTYGRIRAIRQF